MKPLYDWTIEYYPETFKLLQKEAFLANSCILSGFNFLVKGNFTAAFVGAYYAAFFHLTIGIERLLKLVYISDYMMEHNMSFPEEKKLKQFGHNINMLLNNCRTICEKYNIICEKSDSINKKIINFLTSFTNAQKGRYFNLRGQYNKQDNPLWHWQDICIDILKIDMAKNNKFVSNNLKIIEDSNIEEDIEAYIVVHQLLPKCNHYIVLRLIEILKPFIRTLEKISSKHHYLDTNNKLNEYPSIPYFEEIFHFIYLPRDYILRKKRWIDYISY